MSGENSTPKTKVEKLSFEIHVVPVVRLLVLLWAILATSYFLAREGLLTFAPLCKVFPVLARILPESFVGDPDQQGSYLLIIKSLFFEPYHIWWENIPWSALLVAGGMAILYVVLGWLVLDWFEDCIPTAPRLALAFALGCGITGVVFELITLAGLLYQPVVAAVWCILLGLAWGVRRWRRSQLDPLYPKEEGALVRDRRRGSALAYFWDNTLGPSNTTDKSIALGVWCVIGVISLLILIHGIALPETYWDSLILYMGYARMMFDQHSFPVKVCGQVGIGLGANYPHLYPLLTAQTATLAGAWNDVYAQLLPPLAGIASVILVYATVLEFTRDRLLSAACALLFRAVPYGIAYFQYASDYAVAILFTAAFLYAAGRYIVSGSRSALFLMWGFPAFAVHINYLMWVLWPVALLATVLAHVRGGSCERFTVPQAESVPSEHDEWEDDWELEDERDLTPYEIKAWNELNHTERLSLRDFLRSKLWWGTLLISLVVASPWYIRNIVVTGNPVYAFFYNIFPSKNVNPEVMRSAEVEWRLNGDGLGRVGKTLGEKLSNSWYYFVTGPHHWKLGPVFIGYVVPGVLLFFAALLVAGVKWWRSRRECPGTEKFSPLDDWTKFSLVATLLFFLLWFYAYCVADMYLYQIIVVLPVFAVFIARLFEFCPTVFTRRTLYILCLIVGIAPGILMAAMGFKLKKSGMVGAMPYSQLTLTALRNPFIDKDLFLRMEFDGDMTMLRHVNALAPGTILLTHENRHLLLDPKIKIVHLDDWEVQQTYRKPLAERLRILDALGIQFYLYVPNEDKHRVNSLVGMDELIDSGYFREVFRTDSSGTSWRDGLTYKAIPPDKNVLYHRTAKKP